MQLSTLFSLITIFFSIFALAVLNIEELSIGKSGKIHSVNGAIEYFHLIGVPNPPEVLSDKIILTPPTPGNSRGAIWSDKVLNYAHWNVDVDFRVTGPERAGGNIQIWYVKDGQQTVGTSSIYTVGKFDGLALTIDQYAGSGGSIRGFLNDGTTNYKSHHKVDSLSFGHCDYSYRNLGRPSRLSFSQFDNGLHVSIDGKECFASEKVTLPAGYSLGITAAGAELPDSVEIFKVFTTVDAVSIEKATKQQEPIQNSETKESREPAKFIKDSHKSTIQTDDQSLDINTRLHSIMKQVNKFQQTLVSSQTQHTSKQDEIINKLRVIESKLDNFLEIKKDIGQMKEDFHKSLDQHIKGLRGDVRDTQNSLMNTHLTLHDVISDRMSLTTLAFLFFCGQAILLVGYIVYKRRRKDSIKKFL
ncbi:hypothetical protein EPUL_003549 [Erysiphe pulchra]|uniref:L-type lectin-like domain-containing protein n=1 Tax=Erysiphe pulchra TaxID=225359 RepID=A0A2S4PNL5_9PEZI|nr:hypothetical protein EPUL_003549 [Erysiphe pulchra]